MDDVAGLRVLVVEDEGIVALLIEEMLEELGCTTAASVTSVQAAKVVASSAAVDLAILDVNLAGEFIYPVADILEKRGIPFLFSTGYGAAPLQKPHNEREVLTKPFSLDQLREKMRRAIGRPNLGVESGI